MPGISHPITPHTFRHSRITPLIQEGVNESVIKLMMWGNLSTDMFRTYAHLTNADIDGPFWRFPECPCGKKKPRGLRPVVCPTCQKRKWARGTVLLCVRYGPDRGGESIERTNETVIRDNPKIFIKSRRGNIKRGGREVGFWGMKTGLIKCAVYPVNRIKIPVITENLTVAMS